MYLTYFYQSSKILKEEWPSQLHIRNNTGCYVNALPFLFQ